MQTFERDRIAIRYPESWDIEEAEDAESGAWTVTVSSPETAFLMMSLQPEADHPGDIADQTLEALRADYQELDAENVVETICGLPAVGFNADFITADTTTTCRVRCVATDAGPLLLMVQVSEYDRARNEPVLAAIMKSLDVDTDD
ncbi:hypothetical protein GobsT_20660 [Gemmata obscuriglobus]|uniref:DUF1795 domain-containing protein n=1 Tax=Gemmata obscuriglobus TaxID=114 RepID=A0A2Z3GYL2_9BACT|nr:hypothetical protein [Gemmata obscuriglobus]AWM39589.1 hypothetical protein C1280_23060 [Gemmata obscuriglobus]QEG27312.1 hypothetical protein GobsT_20660 [Gemmata obscuriglobus]VTS04139.1 Uncharacterized protein OS=Singulisphaera acidiphila (strain ATCC BAA-1392 / DSM 18658 / VKM B-2454 / MOB10) GN=Sinac_7295 PE=4 SV=1 [Gemmata obscuriglobus UQM 2246]